MRRQGLVGGLVAESDEVEGYQGLGAVDEERLGAGAHDVLDRLACWNVFAQITGK